MQLPAKIPYELMLTKWKSLLDPLLSEEPAPDLEIFNGYFVKGNQWADVSLTFVDIPSIGSTPVLTTGFSQGNTFSKADNSLAGIKFLPKSKDALYFVSFTLGHAITTNGANAYLRLSDGMNAFAYAMFQAPGAGKPLPATLCGVYRPNTTAQVTIRLQGAMDAGAVGYTTVDWNNVVSPNLSLSIFQIR